MKRILLLLAISACALGVRAHEHYVVQHFSIKDGLNRFDGYTFTVFKAMNDGVEASVNNRVTIIYEDEQERIWWGTYDDHFYRLDATRKVTVEQPYDSLPEAMLVKMADRDKKTQVDSRGIIWQADATNGIQRYRFGQWKRFTPPLDRRYEGRLRENFFMLEDSQGRTWVNPTGGGWSYYDFDKDELVYPIHGLTNMIHTAYVDKEGQMWIATYDGGVDCVNMEPTPYQLHDMRRSASDNGEVRAFVNTKIPFCIKIVVCSRENIVKSHDCFNFVRIILCPHDRFQA